MWSQSSSGRKRSGVQRRKRSEDTLKHHDEGSGSGKQSQSGGQSADVLRPAELRGQLRGVGFPVSVEVVLNVADRHFLTLKGGMQRAGELTNQDLLQMIDEFVFLKNGDPITSPFDKLRVLKLIWKHFEEKLNLQVKMSTFDALYGFKEKDVMRLNWVEQITSLAVSSASPGLMDCVAWWMKLHSVDCSWEVSRKIYQEFCVQLPDAHKPLMGIARASQRLAYQLTLDYTSHFMADSVSTLPPIVLVRVMSNWLTVCPELLTMDSEDFEKPYLLKSNPPVNEPIPLVGLMRWSVIGPLLVWESDRLNAEYYFDFHHCLLVAIGHLQVGRTALGMDQLMGVAQLLLELGPKLSDERQLSKAVDRLAQILQLCVSTQTVEIKAAELNNLLKLLPANRLLAIVVKHCPATKVAPTQ